MRLTTILAQWIETGSSGILFTISSVVLGKLLNTPVPQCTHQNKVPNSHKEICPAGQKVFLLFPQPLSPYSSPATFQGFLSS